MKFEIELDGHCEQAVIEYINSEYSLDSSPQIFEIDFDLALNKLNLTVVNDYIVRIWGYLGSVKTNISHLGEPKCSPGKLKVIGEFEGGFSYRINDNILPMYFDEYSGWICIGNQDSVKDGVEFIKNCVAFLNDDGSLNAVWIKPIFVDK